MRTVYASPVTSSFPCHATADGPIRRHLSPGQSAAMAAIWSSMEISRRIPQSRCWSALRHGANWQPQFQTEPRR